MTDTAGRGNNGEAPDRGNSRRRTTYLMIGNLARHPKRDFDVEDVPNVTARQRPRIPRVAKGDSGQATSLVRSRAKAECERTAPALLAPLQIELAGFKFGELPA
jgi:hypothetical protein